MKTRSAQVNPGISNNQRETARRSLWLAGLFVFAVAVILAATAAPVFSRQAASPQASQTTSVSGVKCVIGVQNHKPNSKGTLSVLPTGLEFKTEKKKDDIPIASITDIFTGNQSRQAVTGAGSVIKMGIPYGGGRIVSAN